MAKQLEANSILNSADLDGDGIVTDEELDKHERMIRMENDDKKEDQIRLMAWFALGGMLIYPAAVVLSVVFGVTTAAEILGDMAPTYFTSVSLLVAAFFGAQAYGKKTAAKKDEKW